eukprot:CAMPEP_0201606364 /NCGR_PEP_ID=MMETSP0492-20130828/5841_1 /ASSEMBLY_ACC=CAM_ASM_000837 /TAXON_ID=420259 /ORGANISM="Thalassiosira gravida, Strain GMp14c1" /LENGTH=237 /DNA_ID=CAMNT_0048070751 /DNA_START=35 /DNA_END=745 /DNA_ORIENTATION=+
MTSIRRQSNLSLLCYLYVTLHHLHHLQLASSRLSQSHSSHSLPRSLPISNNCLDAPCTYKNECRDQNGICGESATHCNGRSVWMPACGGGSGLDKPTPAAAPAPDPMVIPLPPPPPTNRPTNVRRETMAPSLNPTTAWDLWISNKNQPTTTSKYSDNNNDNYNDNNDNAKEDQSNNNTTAKEGNGYTFDADRWGYYGEEEEKGILDQMKDLATLNKAEAGEQINGMILLTTTAVLAW